MVALSSLGRAMLVVLCALLPMLLLPAQADAKSRTAARKHYARGYELLVKRRYSSARRAFRAALREAPTDPAFARARNTIRYFLGVCAWRLRRYREAGRHLRRYLRGRVKPDRARNARRILRRIPRHKPPPKSTVKGPPPKPKAPPAKPTVRKIPLVIKAHAAKALIEVETPAGSVYHKGNVGSFKLPPGIYRVVVRYGRGRIRRRRVVLAGIGATIVVHPPPLPRKGRTGRPKAKGGPGSSGAAPTPAPGARVRGKVVPPVGPGAKPRNAVPLEPKRPRPSVAVIRPGPSELPSKVPPRRRGSLVGPVVLLSTGGAGVAAATVLGFLAQSSFADSEDAANRGRNGETVHAGTVSGLYSSGQNRMTAAYIAGGAGIGLAAAGLVWLITRSIGRPAEARSTAGETPSGSNLPSLATVPTREGAAFVVRGTF